MAKWIWNIFYVFDREYDTLQLQLESSMSRIENEVKQYQEEILANETKHNMLELKKMQLELLERRASDEVKLYVSNKVIIWIDSYWLKTNIYFSTWKQ